MVAANFDKALTLLLAHEGGYVNHPRDPGGATNMGVTQKTYSTFRRAAGKPEVSVRSISESEVASIYRTSYWLMVRADDLAAGLDYAVFDFGVNSGPSRAIRFLQKAAGADVDGIIGPKTLAAVARHKPEDLINAILDARLAWLRTLDTWNDFGRGWSNRIADVRRDGLAMARGAAAAVTDTADEPAWLTVAREYLGEKEIAGSRHNPVIQDFFKRVTGQAYSDETAWCAAFVGGVLDEAGLPHTGELLARSYLKYGDVVAEPRVGDIVVFWRGSPNSWQGHVAFFLGLDGDRVRVLGGNQSDAVTVATYPESRVLGYRRPAGQAPAVPPQPDDPGVPDPDLDAPSESPLIRLIRAILRAINPFK